MRVFVNYSAQLRDAAGIQRELLELEGPRPIRDFAELLAQRRGEGLRRAIFDGANSLRRNIIVSVNDEQIYPGDNRLLSDCDEVTLLSPISGG
jgi:molybdopterin converting factor small subunit